MSGYEFTYQITAHGKLVAEIDCELRAEVVGNRVEVTDVYADNVNGDNYVNLWTSDDPLLVMLAERIAKAAEASDRFCEEVFDAEGIYYVGGANNPSGHYVSYDR